MDQAALLAQISEVCPLPRTAARILALSNDPRADFGEIASAVECDPALATEILRIARSPAYRTRYGADDDLRAACRLLGQREVGNVTAALSMLSMFTTEHELALHAHEVSALAAQMAALTMDALRLRGRSQAFLAGLLSEIGALACLSIDAEAYVALRAANPTEADRVIAETRRYHAHSFTIGAHLLARNGISPEICRAVHGVDHDPISSVVRFSRRGAAAMIEAADSGDRGWLRTLETLLSREGLALEPSELALVAGDAFDSTARRLAA
ncbi:MAG: HDOD domain-containing protein [Sandaracinaceae bacterium]